MSAARADQADVGAEPDDPPFAASARMLPAQLEHVVHAEVERLGHLTPDRPRRWHR